MVVGSLENYQKLGLRKRTYMSALADVTTIDDVAKAEEI